MIDGFDEEELAAARLSRPGVLLSHDEGNDGINLRIALGKCNSMAIEDTI